MGKYKYSYGWKEWSVAQAIFALATVPNFCLFSLRIQSEYQLHPFLVPDAHVRHFGAAYRSTVERGKKCRLFTGQTLVSRSKPIKIRQKGWNTSRSSNGKSTSVRPLSFDPDLLNNGASGITWLAFLPQSSSSRWRNCNETPPSDNKLDWQILT